VGLALLSHRVEVRAAQSRPTIPSSAKTEYANVLEAGSWCRLTGIKEQFTYVRRSEKGVQSQVRRFSAAGATHAWMQVYLPGAGWVDFDPTNNIVGNRNPIRVAVAWDPQQALPLWGSFIGSTSSFRGMEVEVSVAEEYGCAC
jgi:hypothetical protein